MARPKVLHVWWGDLHVAEITAKRWWDLRLAYTKEALDRFPTGRPLISCSLPLRSKATSASPFLRGLLPEGQHLQAVAGQAGVTTADTFGLLSRYGKDTAGALVITPDEGEPDASSMRFVPYTDDELAEEVADLDNGSMGVRADSELSIAGLQNKMLLVRTDDGWARPVRGYPSTHILKIDDGRHGGLVAAEADCLDIAHEVGMTRARPVLVAIADRDCLIVERYDRTVGVDGSISRLHQEDACQALGIDFEADRGRGKYESHGGPTLAATAGLIAAHAVDREGEMCALLRLVTFSVVTGNADFHGKNISLLHSTDGFISVAPAYDTVPTVLWPNLRKTSAVSINGKVEMDQITAQDLEAEAIGWGLARETAAGVIGELVERCCTSAASARSEAVATLVTTRCHAMAADRPA